MSTKALFMTAMGGALLPYGEKTTFVRSSGNILTATAHGLQTGAGPYKVMGSAATADPPSGLTAAKFAETFVTGATVIATDAIVVGTKTYTAIATPAADGDVDVGASDAETMENFARAINMEPRGNATSYDIDMSENAAGVVAEAKGAVLFVRAKSLDATVGNAIPSTSPDATLTWDNATLEGGVEGTDYYIIRLTDDTFSLATSKANAIAGTAVALADAGTGVHWLQPIVETVAEALESAFVDRAMKTGVRVYPTADNVADFWAGAIAGVCVPHV